MVFCARSRPEKRTKTFNKELCWASVPPFIDCAHVRNNCNRACPTEAIIIRQFLFAHVKQFYVINVFVCEAFVCQRKVAHADVSPHIMWQISVALFLRTSAVQSH